MVMVAWTPAAEQDLEMILLYIGREQQSPSAAARVIRELTEMAETYAAQPLLAATRPEFGSLVRAFHVHRYVVIYRPTENGIEVLRVVHGSRDIFRVLGRNEP
jgi:toxin ParE1/3/4